MCSILPQTKNKYINIDMQKVIPAISSLETSRLFLYIFFLIIFNVVNIRGKTLLYITAMVIEVFETATLKVPIYTE